MVLAVLIALAAAAVDPHEERFLEGLRERRLFALAQTHCLQRLSDSSLPEARRAELVVELSRSYAEHALHSTPAAGEPLWKQALDVTNDFSRRLPESPWLVLVRTQGALVLLLRGELARQQSEVLAQNEKQLEEARGYLRQAVRQLSELREEVARQLMRTRPGTSEDRQPSREQLLSLDHNVAFQLARAYRNQGQSYPPASPDRANSLSKAVELLGPLAQLTLADSLVWQARLRRNHVLPAAARLRRRHATPRCLAVAERSARRRCPSRAGRADSSGAGGQSARYRAQRRPQRTYS